MKLQTIAIVLSSLWLAVASAAKAADPPFKITNYDVSISLDRDLHSLKGRSRLTVQATAPLSEISVTAPQVAIDGIRGGRQSLASRVEAGRLVVTLPRPLPAGGRVVVEVTWHGASPRGLSLAERAMWSGYFICDWMICDQDRPGDKATLDLAITAPKGLETLGPGEPAGATVSGGLKTTRWREVRPYSPYLFGFVVGDFHWTEVGDSKVRLPVLSRQPDAEVKRAFVDASAMMAFFADKAGVAYPHRAYRQTLLPAGAAQEADGFGLLGADQVLPVLTAPHEDYLVAHEMAHQWWGNLVTCASWKELWLNEGLVTFMTAAWKEHRWGRADYEREIQLAQRRWDMAKAQGLDTPLAEAGAIPALQTRRAIAYSKGALFLDRLRRGLGETAFWAGIRAYTRRFAGGTVTSHDLEAELERASGRDLAPLFKAWVYAPA